MELRKHIDLVQCYMLAWRSFAKWWIPLCILSAGIFLFRLGPRILSGEEMDGVYNGMLELAGALSSDDDDRLLLELESLEKDLGEAMGSFARYSALAMPFIALLWSALLLSANRAVKDRKDRQPRLKVAQVALWRTALLALKIAPLIVLCIYLVVLREKEAAFEQMNFALIATLLALTPFWGALFYIKLLFVPLLMFERGMGGFQACRISWTQTGGHFLKLLLLIVINIVIQAVAMLTVIGIIPVLSFVETVRAAAFRMTLDESSC